jgi:hypothetical protein
MLDSIHYPLFPSVGRILGLNPHQKAQTREAGDWTMPTEVTTSSRDISLLLNLKSIQYRVDG